MWHALSQQSVDNAVQRSIYWPQCCRPNKHASIAYPLVQAGKDTKSPYSLKQSAHAHVKADLTWRQAITAECYGGECKYWHYCGPRDISCKSEPVHTCCLTCSEAECQCKGVYIEEQDNADAFGRQQLLRGHRLDAKQCTSLISLFLQGLFPCQHVRFVRGFD